MTKSQIAIRRAAFGEVAPAFCAGKDKLLEAMAGL